MTTSTKDQASADKEQGSDQALLENLQKELEQTKQSQEEMLQQTQRTLADYANLKKRFEKEREELRKVAEELTLLRFLPAIDNLERAVSFATEEERRGGLFVGIKMTLQQFVDTFSQMGIKKLPVSIGDTFDPHQHDAVEMVEGPPNQIVEILESGYSLEDKVIRPARVKVGGQADIA